MGGAVIGNLDFKGNDFAFKRSWVSTDQCFDSDQIGVGIDNDCFFEVIADG